MSNWYRLWEWLTQRAALALAQSSQVPPGRRSEHSRQLLLLERRLAAFDTLRNVGHHEEASRILAEVAESLRHQESSFAVSTEDTQKDDVCGEGRSRETSLAQEPRDMAKVRQAVSVRLSRLDALVAGPKAVRRRRNRRIFGTVSVLVGATSLLFALIQRPNAPSAIASAQFPGREFRPAHACDGERVTEWLLPDDELGWVECRFDERESVRRVLVTNGRNRDYRDRGAGRISVELVRDGEVVASTDAEFDAVGERVTRRVAVEHAEVDAVRVRVRSFLGLGGALAEVAWE